MLASACCKLFVVGHHRVQLSCAGQADRCGEVDGVERGDRGREDSLGSREDLLVQGNQDFSGEKLLDVLQHVLAQPEAV